MWRDKAAVRQAVGAVEAEAATRVRCPGHPRMGEQVAAGIRRAGRSVVEVGGALRPVRCAHLSLSGARYVLATSYSVVWGSTPCATLVLLRLSGRCIGTLRESTECDNCFGWSQVWWGQLGGGWGARADYFSCTNYRVYKVHNF